MEEIYSKHLFLHIAISICHKQKIYYKQCTWSGQTEFIYRLRGLRINCAKLQPPVISGGLTQTEARERTSTTWNHHTEKN